MREPASTPPLRTVRLGIRECAVERRPDGTIMLRAQGELGLYPAKITERLVDWARAAPDRPFMAERDARGGWRTITYAETLHSVRCIGAALLARDLAPDRPIAILSGNDIEHALLGLGAAYVGIPHAPISPAYSLVSSDFGKLRHVINLLTPGLVFVADGKTFGRAIDAAVPPGTEIVATRNASAKRPTTPFHDLTRGPDAAVEAAHDKVGADTIVKFLFTSGSAGMPKAVINTQRMWCANQMMLRTALAFFQDDPPVIVDWAPWHHTAGGNHDVGLVLYNGGTLYIDEGKPLPGAIEATVRNLRDVAPTWYFSVPKGFEALLPYLRSDERLRANFFSRLKVLWFAGAGIAQHVFDEMKDLAVTSCGEEILFLTGFGATETAPFALARTWRSANATNMGLPAVGMDLKLVPCAGKLEARVKGPNVTPGYWRDADLTAAAFDDEGFYRLGDAFKFADPANAGAGLLFDGRIAEDFKLATGTWVSVGPLRARLIEHFAPFMRDAVITGADRDEIGVLIFPEVEACRRLAPDLPDGATAAALVADPRVIDKFRCLLGTLAQTATGSSVRVCRAMLLDEPPSLDRGEVTDKGSINQRIVLQHRAALVEEMYGIAPLPRVIALEQGA